MPDPPSLQNMRPSWWMGSYQRWNPPGNDEPRGITGPAATPEERDSRDRLRHVMGEAAHIANRVGLGRFSADAWGGAFGGLRALRRGEAYDVPSHSGELFDALADNPDWDRYDIARFVGAPEPSLSRLRRTR